MFDRKAAHNELIELTQTQMPFGKYKGRLICDLPETYLLWFKQKGFPKNRIGHLLAIMCEIKIEGIESIVYELRKRI